MPTAGFPKAARLRHASEFARVIQKGRVTMTTTMRFVVAAGATDHARLGLTVARRAGSAVVRNRIKRWAREAFRQIAPTLAAVDIVAAPRYERLPQSLAEVVTAFSELTARYPRVATTKLRDDA